MVYTIHIKILKEKRKHKRSIKKSKREESKEISKYKLKGNV